MPYLTDMYHAQNKTAESAHSNGTVNPTTAPGFSRDELVASLSSRILGQSNAVEAVARAVSIGHVGVADPDRPLASVLLVGPTGVGKTELVRRLAAHLRSGPDDLCRIDMAALAQEHYAASFSGAPPGYAGSKESFTLFDKDRIEGNAYTPGIVLLDEIEKADPTVIRALLHILDSGELRLANGREKISFRNSYIFITSNLGSREVADSARTSANAPWWRQLLTRATARTDGRRRGAIIDAVEEFFDPEFVNRIDEIAVLDPLTVDTSRAVIAREVDELSRRLARESLTLHVDDSVLALLQDNGFDPVYGARGLRRSIRTLLVSPVAECILRERPHGQQPLALHATATGAGVTVRRSDTEAGEPTR